MSQTQTFFDTLVVEHCCSCGVSFGLSKDLYNKRVNDHLDFYCPNGHGQHYLGKSEADRLKDQLNEKERTISYLREANSNLHSKVTDKNHQIRAHKAAKTRILNRVKNGVCPCCNRHFTNLEQHMKTKHPNHEEALQ